MEERYFKRFQPTTESNSKLPPLNPAPKKVDSKINLLNIRKNSSVESSSSPRSPMSRLSGCNPLRISIKRKLKQFEEKKPQSLE